MKIIIRLEEFAMFVHASLDRVFGYGLKYAQGFKYTYLGVPGKE
ncbi:MAG TPA: DUF4260 family protein [Puia sp.]|nr:DUF4260 family protein [Puia sp.]